MTFGEIPFQETLRKARRLREQAEKESLFYTALRASIFELFAMDWMGKHQEQLSLVQRLKKKMNKKTNAKKSSDPTLRFNLLILEGRALAGVGRIKGALSCIRKCEVLCRSFSNPLFHDNIGSLYSTIGFHKKARHWIEKNLKYGKNIHKILMAANFAIAGEYYYARKTLKNVDMKKSGFRTLTTLINARCHFGQGKVQDAAKFANETLSEARKARIIPYLWSSSLVLACCLCSFGERKKAKELITKVVPVLKKYGMKRSLFLAQILLGQNSLPPDAILMPNIKLAFLLSQASESLKMKDYRKTYQYANSHQLIGLFHQLILFFPGPVNKLIEKGKFTDLPKTLLKLPVFQENIPVYHLRFLGPVRICRNGVCVRTKLAPMHIGLLIQLVFMKKIELKSLYKNLWARAKNPRGSLSHLLFGVRKYLRLLPGTLFIKQGFLHFKGYITTDYQEVEQTLTRAKALERADEWTFAKREYLRAFKLFRGEPFKKMYDPWSEHMRRVILNELETEALHFAKSCLEHDNEIRQKKRRTPKGTADAKKVLEKVLKIIPDSEEIREMVGEYGGNGVSEKRK